jgi:glycosyl transferase family 2
VRSVLPTTLMSGRSRLRRVERRDAERPSREQFRPLVSVVIPARNEQQNIEWVLERLPSAHEVILVDGCSTDDTVAVARSARPGIVVLSDHGTGKGDALRVGFNAASGHFVVMLDADGSMDPREIPRFVDALMDGHDIVKGSRLLPGGGSADLSRLRSAGNRVLCGMVNVLYRARFTDLCYGYFAFRKSCLPLLKLCTDGFEIETEMVVCSLKAGLRITEVPSYELPRRHGASNLNAARDGVRVLYTLLLRRVSHFPGRLHNPWDVPVTPPRQAAAWEDARPQLPSRARDRMSPKDLVSAGILVAAAAVAVAVAVPLVTDDQPVAAPARAGKANPGDTVTTSRRPSSVGTVPEPPLAASTTPRSSEHREKPSRTRRPHGARALRRAPVHVSVARATPLPTQRAVSPSVVVRPSETRPPVVPRRIAPRPPRSVSFDDSG